MTATSTKDMPRLRKVVLSRPRMGFAFLVFSLLLMLTLGLASYQTASQVTTSRDGVVHTYRVRSELQDLQRALLQARANRSAYFLTGDTSQLEIFREIALSIPSDLKSLRVLTAENSGQQDRLNRLDQLVAQQLAELHASVNLHAIQTLESKEQIQSTKDIVAREAQINSIISDMVSQEEGLSVIRLKLWNKLFRRNLVIFGIAFLAAVLLLVYNFWLLIREIARIKEVEKVQSENAVSYRALSARILELQDLERRKIARELHDSVGQFLAGLKINLSQLEAAKGAATHGRTELLTETIDLTDRAIGEVRTISHLLHPPLLDELGFESAAKWYAEGFAKRSGLQVKVIVGEIVERLPREVELALFRVLQETLTNAHRHADARSIDICVTCETGKVILTIQDDGKGIPYEALLRYRAGLAAGVGLAGMRERMAELDGELDVESTRKGTRVRATLPTKECENVKNHALHVAQR